MIAFVLVVIHCIQGSRTFPSCAESERAEKAARDRERRVRQRSERELEQRDAERRVHAREGEKPEREEEEEEVHQVAWRQEQVEEEYHTVELPASVQLPHDL